MYVCPILCVCSNSDSVTVNSLIITPTHKFEYSQINKSNKIRNSKTPYDPFDLSSTYIGKILIAENLKGMVAYFCHLLVRYLCQHIR